MSGCEIDSLKNQQGSVREHKHALTLDSLSNPWYGSKLRARSLPLFKINRSHIPENL